MLLYSVINSPDDCHQLQNDLNTLDQWANKWRMVFKHSKCEYLKIKLTLSLYTISKISKLKRSLMPDIWVSSLSHLTWNEHIKYVTIQANNGKSFLQRNPININIVTKHNQTLELSTSRSGTINLQ